MDARILLSLMWLVILSYILQPCQPMIFIATYWTTLLHFFIFSCSYFGFFQPASGLAETLLDWVITLSAVWLEISYWMVILPPCPNCIALWVGFVNKKEISGLCLLPLSFHPPLTIPHPTSSSPDNNSPITSRLLATGGRGSRWLRQATARWRGITERCQDCHNLTHAFHIGLFCMGEKTGKCGKSAMIKLLALMII